MRAYYFLDETGAAGPQPAPQPPAARRQLALSVLVVSAVLASGGALSMFKYLAAPGTAVPRPGPRRFGPLYRHVLQSAAR